MLPICEMSKDVKVLEEEEFLGLLQMFSLAGLIFEFGTTDFHNSPNGWYVRFYEEIKGRPRMVDFAEFYLVIPKGKDG